MKSPVFFICLILTVPLISGSAMGISTPEPGDSRIRNDTIFEDIGGLFSKGADFGKKLIDTLTDWIEGLVAGSIKYLGEKVEGILIFLQDPFGMNDRLLNADSSTGFVNMTTLLFVGVIRILVFIGIIRVWVLIADIIPVL